MKLESVEDLVLGVWLGREVTLTFLCRYLPDNHKFNCRGSASRLPHIQKKDRGKVGFELNVFLRNSLPIS